MSDVVGRWTGVAARPDEVTASRPGDDLVAGDRIVVMDRGFSVAAPPDAVWPWLVQLGKQRAGWYLPAAVERWVPRSHRAIRHLDPRWQDLAVGDVIPDYGGARGYFEVARSDPPSALVHLSARGRVQLSWALCLTPETLPSGARGTRVHLRLRLGPVRRAWLARSGGELLDVLTVAGLAAGLRERVATPTRPG